MSQIFKYTVTHNIETDDFYGDVTDEHGYSVYSIYNKDLLVELIQDGYLIDAIDVDGLRDYLVTHLVLSPHDKLLRA